MSDKEIILQSLRIQLKQAIGEKVGQVLDVEKVKQLRKAIKCIQQTK